LKCPSCRNKLHIEGAVIICISCEKYVMPATTQIIIDSDLFRKVEHIYKWQTIDFFKSKENEMS
jgi:hypothetical protein